MTNPKRHRRGQRRKYAKSAVDAIRNSDHVAFDSWQHDSVSKPLMGRVKTDLKWNAIPREKKYKRVIRPWQ